MLVRPVLVRSTLVGPTLVGATLLRPAAVGAVLLGPAVRTVLLGPALVGTVLVRAALIGPAAVGAVLVRVHGVVWLVRRALAVAVEAVTLPVGALAAVGAGARPVRRIIMPLGGRRVAERTLVAVPRLLVRARAAAPGLVPRAGPLLVARVGTGPLLVPVAALLVTRVRARPPRLTLLAADLTAGVAEGRPVAGSVVEAFRGDLCSRGRLAHLHIGDVGAGSCIGGSVDGLCLGPVKTGPRLVGSIPGGQDIGRVDELRDLWRHGSWGPPGRVRICPYKP